MKELRQFVKGGGGRPFILKIRFCAMGWGDGLDMYQQLLGGFGSMRAILPMRGLTCGLMSKSYMPIQSWGKSGALAYFGLKIGYSGYIFWDVDFKFVLPIICINIKRQIQLEVNWTQLDYFIL